MMKAFDSQRSRESRSVSWCACRCKHDIGLKVAKKTVHWVFENRGIDVNGGFANALDWDVAQERQAMVVEHAKVGGALVICKCRGRLNKIKYSLSSFRTMSMIGTLDLQWPRLSRRPSILRLSMTDSSSVMPSTQAAISLLLRLARVSLTGTNELGPRNFSVKESDKEGL